MPDRNANRAGARVQNFRLPLERTVDNRQARFYNG
jgi:hypothetical protein